jgi:hypothetical protein
MGSKDHGSIARNGGGRIKWYDLSLFRFDDDLESGDGSCVGVDGHAKLLARGRLSVTTADRFVSGAPQGWALDIVTGYTAAWWGLGTPRVVEDLILTFGEGPAITDIVFSEYGMSTGSRLWSGQLVLASQPAKSKRRRIGRALAQGAGRNGSRLVVWENPAPQEWPPAPRERHKVNSERLAPLPWDQRGHGVLDRRASYSYY